MAQTECKTIIEPGNPERIEDFEYSLEEYIKHFSHLVELEREEEMKRHEKEMKNLSGREREREGRAILNTRARKEGKGLGGKFLVKFVRRDGLPKSEISVGDLIRVSKNEPLSDNNPTATVTEKTRYSLTVAFENKPPSWIFDKVRIDLYVNDITYQRMLDALSKLKNLKGKKRELIDKIISKKELKFKDYEEVFYCNQNLNESQKKAVKKALLAKNFYLIHGPPGTGKTVTCIEVIEQVIEKGKKVIACADSNTAVDNLVEHLVNKERDVVRVGHPARVTPMLRKHTLDYLVEKNSAFQNSQKLREKASALKEEQEKYVYPSGRWRRGLSNEAIKSLSDKNKGSRGIPASKMKEMAKYLEIQEKIDDLFEEIEELEKKAVDEILSKADVICTTNSSSGSEIIENRDFDICVIDEATQATEPSCLIPVLKTNKLIMAGDHKQLPPTILNEEAKRKGLSETMFERLIAMCCEEVKSLLKVQYRMNEKIMKFSSMTFYDGQVIADKSVRDHILEDLIEGEVNGKFSKIFDQSDPIVLIDTMGNMTENTRRGSTSKENKGEAILIKEMLSYILDKGVSAKDVGIITPYKDQKDLISSSINYEEIEVDTVDGFQGREKELILLSLTRSNEENDIGFLRDLRRLNVSITRAKRKLIIIGDRSTVSSEQVYGRLFDYIEENGKVIKVKI
ncbi:MAG: IGHMBP2 family helicase [Thermoplasmatota archaeon]